MSSLEYKAILEALLPKGSAWRPAPDGDFDKFLDGVSDYPGTYLYQNGLALAFLREPRLIDITLLRDLEKEYGVLTTSLKTTTKRRDELHSIVYAKPGSGGETFLERMLQDAGFNLTVQQNDPALDPSLIIGELYYTYAGDAWAHPTTIAGVYTQGELIVNGTLYTQCQGYLMQCGGDIAYAGHARALAGYFLKMIRTPFEYPVPQEAWSWPFIFFVAESFSGWDDEPPIPIVTPGTVANLDRDFLIRLILKYKPLHSWCGLIVNYV